MDELDEGSVQSVQILRPEGFKCSFFSSKELYFGGLGTSVNSPLLAIPWNQPRPEPVRSLTYAVAVRFLTFNTFCIHLHYTVENVPK